MLNLIVIDNRKGIYTAMTYITEMFKYLRQVKGYVELGINSLVNKSEKEIHDLFIKKYKKLPDNILLFLTKFTFLDTIKIPNEIKINIIIDDIHQVGPDKTHKILELKKCHRIFSSYGYIFHSFFPPDVIGNVPVFFLPHTTSHISNFNNAPIARILISGRLRPDVYPFRQFMYDLSKTNKNLEYLPVNFKYRIKTDKPEYIYGKKYVDYLNKYLVCFTCEANKDTPYILIKFFEILGSGSLLLAWNPITKKNFEELGFIDNVHYISVTMENIYQKINYVLDPQNRYLINEIRKNGYELLKNNHTIMHRAMFLDKILRDG